jgi:hypothetical protein
MKRINIKIFTALTASAIVLASCLKDKDYEDGLRGNNIDEDIRLVEISGPTDGFRTADYVASPVDTTVNAVMVTLASAKPATSDIQVTLALDNSLVAAYNAAHGTSYDVAPANLYSIPSLTVTIPAGSSVGYLKIKAKPTDFIGQEYALGFKLASVSDPGVKLSGNFNQQVVALVTRNQYDGTYTLKFAFYHPTASPDYGKKSTVVELHTTGANSVKLYWPLLGGYAPPIISGGGFSYFASQEPEFTIDPVTNKVTVQNAFPGAVTFYQMAPGYDSRYDPATKTIYAKFGYNYSPGPVFNPATNREWTDTLIYQGPR